MENSFNLGQRSMIVFMRLMEWNELSRHQQGGFVFLWLEENALRTVTRSCQGRNPKTDVVGAN
jgi:hypothetical protein